jgi:hypothetical protein
MPLDCEKFRSIGVSNNDVPLVLDDEELRKHPRELLTAG